MVGHRPGANGRRLDSCPATIEKLEALDTTTPLDGFDAASLLVSRGWQRGGVSLGIASLAGAGIQEKRLAGGQDCRVRRCRSCRVGRVGAPDRELGIREQDEAVLAARRSSMFQRNCASGFKRLPENECISGRICLPGYEQLPLTLNSSIFHRFRSGKPDETEDPCAIVSA